MVYNTSDYCFFWTFSIVWYSKEHSVSETGSICPQVRGQETLTLLGPLETGNLNHRIHLFLLYNFLLTSVDKP
jgi:hypothetical protein